MIKQGNPQDSQKWNTCFLQQVLWENVSWSLAKHRNTLHHKDY